MKYFFTRQLLPVLLLANFSLVSAQAQPLVTGIVSTQATVDFDPSQILMIVEYPKGMIRFAQAAFSPQPISASPLSTERRYLVAAKLALKKGAEETFDYAFLLIDEQGSHIQVSPVKRWHLDRLAKSNKGLENLKTEIGKLESKLTDENSNSESPTSELVKLRNELANSVDIPRIVSLKLGIQQKQAELEQRENNIRVLRTLVQSIRGRESSDSFAQLRKELSDDLRNIAATTAKTERLQRRKVNTAEMAIRNKLKLIRQTEGQDIQALAAHVLALRRERRALEVKLGITPNNSHNDEF